MSDNVKGELAGVLARCGVLFDGTQGHQTRCAIAAELLAHLAERGMVVLGPDGEPLDVRPLLRALGRRGFRWANDAYFGATPEIIRSAALVMLTIQGITGPLASTCLAAAETDPS